MKINIINIMTELELENIIEKIKEQFQYEDNCQEAFKMLFPHSHEPVFCNFIWPALANALDAALGLEDFLIGGFGKLIAALKQIWQKFTYPVQKICLIHIPLCRLPMLKRLSSMLNILVI